MSFRYVGYYKTYLRIDLPISVETPAKSGALKMHTDIGIRPSVSSLATNIQDWIKPLATQIQRWITSLVKEAMVLDLSANWIHNVILPVAVLAGAAAFGFWWSSVSAGLFACFALFF